MKTLPGLEELGFFLLSLYLFSLLSFPWWYFPLLLLAPDVSMLGYLGGPRIGASIYNVVHHRGLSLALYMAALLLHLPGLALAGLILFAHSSLDRVFGYGLKLPDSFSNTHLGDWRAAAARIRPPRSCHAVRH